jgi:D-arginine dehydrogenase
MAEVDFLIVGSGIAGASAAAFLSSEARVAVIERESAHGYHTTGRSAALYSPIYGSAAFRALTVASRPFFDDSPPGFAAHPLLRDRGVLYIGREDQRASLEREAAGATTVGMAVDWLTPDEAIGICPVLRREALAAAFLEPTGMDIDVEAMHQGYLRLARAQGAQILLHAELVALDRSRDRWRARLANGETLDAGVVIDAAGAWADQVAALAGVAPIGLTPMRRTAFIIDPPEGLDVTRWPAVIDADEDFYFKPEAGKLLVSPADETPSEPCDAWAEDMVIAECVERMQQAADLPVRRINRSWAGLRTFAPDRDPVIGYEPGAEGFFWLAGQGGYGVQSSAGAGRTAAALALGRPAPEDVRALGLIEAQIGPARLRGV